MSLSEIRGQRGLHHAEPPASALNALSLEHDSPTSWADLLEDWRDDDAGARGGGARQSTRRGRSAPSARGAIFASSIKRPSQGDDALIEDFFTEEYALNHLIHTYRQTVHRIDGRHRDGGRYGHQPRLRVCASSPSAAKTGHARNGNIGLFPDVGGGYFLSRCQWPPGRVPCADRRHHWLTGREAIDGWSGRWLVLTLADLQVAVWASLGTHAL